MPFLAILLAFLVVDATPPAALAAQVPSRDGAGTSISGSVRDPVYRPVRGARVVVVETGTEVRTDEAGGFRLRVDGAQIAGGLTLRVEAPGYRPAEQRVEAGGGLAEIVLERAPVSLEAIDVAALPVVTGRGIRPGRGTVIDAPAVVAGAPVATLAELLQARVPGVSVFGASGAPGTPVELRIRGIESPWGAGEVPVYVDGIRVDVESWSSLGQTVALPEVAPEDIEAIEVVKGPASTLWYGPDGSRGAILVTTRRRSAGPRGFSQRIVLEHGWVDAGADFPANWARCDGSSGGACAGQPVGQLVSDRPLIRDGMLDRRPASTIHWSGRGGTGRFAAYGSLGWSRDGGIFPGSGFERRGTSLGVHVQPAAAWEVEFGLGVADIDVDFPLPDDPRAGLLWGALVGRPTTIGETEDGWESIDGDSLLTIERSAKSRRIQPLVRVVHTPLPWLTHALVAGANLVQDEVRHRDPLASDIFGRTALSLAERDVKRYTLDYRARLRAIQSEDRTHGLIFLLGAQASRARMDESGRSGYEAAPGEFDSVGPSSAYRQGRVGESVALLAESRYDHRGRFSAELGFRSSWLHGRSSGDRDQLASYRAGLTYLAYDGEAGRERLPGVDAVRFRAAYGAAERLPLPLEAPWLWPPDWFNGLVLVGKERLVEAELGVELDLFDGRIGFAASAFRRTTRDAGLSYRTVHGEQRIHYRLQNQGVEIAADAHLLRGRGVTWTARAVVARLANEAIDAGDMPWKYGFWNLVSDGFPAGGFFVRTVLDLDTTAGRAVVSDEPEFAGGIIPAWEGALDTEVTLWRRLRLRALLDGRSGFHVLNDTDLYRDRLSGNSERAVRRDELPAAERLRYFGPYVGSNGDPGPYLDVVEPYIQDGTFLRVREVAATLELPRAWAARIGGSAVSFTLAGRNVGLWSRYGGIDPEVAAPGRSLTRSDEFRVPQAARWIGRVALQF